MCNGSSGQVSSSSPQMKRHRVVTKVRVRDVLTLCQISSSQFIQPSKKSPNAAMMGPCGCPMKYLVIMQFSYGIKAS